MSPLASGRSLTIDTRTGVLLIVGIGLVLLALLVVLVVLAGRRRRVRVRAEVAERSAALAEQNAATAQQAVALAEDRRLELLAELREWRKYAAAVHEHATNTDDVALRVDFLENGWVRFSDSLPPATAADLIENRVPHLLAIMRQGLLPPPTPPGVAPASEPAAPAQSARPSPGPEARPAPTSDSRPATNSDAHPATNSDAHPAPHTAARAADVLPAAELRPTSDWAQYRPSSAREVGTAGS